MEVPISIGLEIQQQKRVGESIPDGTLVQRSFTVLIETKVDAAVEQAQLLRHSKIFTNEDQQILLLLTKQHVNALELAEINAKLAKESPRVIFRNITYGDICEACNGLFRDHELQMQALIEDYIDYCNEAELVDRSAHLLRIVPCGVSLSLNARHGIYFNPSSRGYSKHRFEGIYAQRRVQYVIDIGSVFDIEYDGVSLEKTLVDGKQTDKYDNKIISMITNAKIECGYEISKNHRFFCGEILPTCFEKSSPNGIQGSRLIDLKKVIGSFADFRDVATKLKAATWK